MRRLGLILVAAAILAAATGTQGLAPAIAAPCEGDECQGPAPAPDDPVPATAVAEGPPNPPVRFSKPDRRKKQRHGKQRHHKPPDRQPGGRR